MLLYISLCFAMVTAVPETDEHHLFDNDTEIDSASDRVAGGSKSGDIERFPYQVDINVKGGRSCSGAIVNEYHILTVARCVRNANPSNTEVRAGSNLRNKGEKIEIKNIVLHPNYHYPSLDSDIAYLKTRKPLKYSRNIQPAHLAIHSHGLPREVLVSGWGASKGGDRVHDDLRHAELPIVANVECREAFPERQITYNSFCAYNSTRLVGPCRGDLGNPASMKYTRRLVGLTSYHGECDPNNREPSVYTYIEAVQVRRFIRNGTGS